MAYSKTNWVNGQTPINETNLNKIENELESLEKGFVNVKNILSQVKQYDYTLSCGLILNFLKCGKMVTCIAQGMISNLTADNIQTVSISTDLKPMLQFRQAFVLDEGGILAYINLTTSSVLEFRVKTAITSNKFPRFSFTYIAEN